MDIKDENRFVKPGVPACVPQGCKGAPTSWGKSFPSLVEGVGGLPPGGGENLTSLRSFYRRYKGAFIPGSPHGYEVDVWGKSSSSLVEGSPFNIPPPFVEGD